MMMKRSAVLLVTLCLLLSAGSLLAREATPEADPRTDV